ncbi:MAG: ubiquinol-cytochrome c reductase iron-sulfur subunit [Herminiimonas sp.]|nr:ubiquinol-cytochrome c reductase iron-sulfur subunit [Herminiimonas sp.]
MSNPETDPHRRQWIAATAGMGAAGLVATLIPFVESMTPSEAAKAAGAPVEADIATLAPGVLKTVEWRGKPVWILHRTEAMLASLGGHDGLLADPHSSQPQQPPYAKNAVRSARPALLVLVGICTHLGCVPTFRPQPGTPDLGADWPGGFYCPCHGSRFDLAGRVFKNVPAPLNLAVPDYAFLSDTRVLIGKGAPGNGG